MPRSTILSAKCHFDNCAIFTLAPAYSHYYISTLYEFSIDHLINWQATLSFAAPAQIARRSSNWLPFSFAFLDMMSTSSPHYVLYHAWPSIRLFRCHSTHITHCNHLFHVTINAIATQIRRSMMLITIHTLNQLFNACVVFDGDAAGEWSNN